MDSVEVNMFTKNYSKNVLDNQAEVLKLKEEILHGKRETFNDLNEFNKAILTIKPN